MSVSLTTPATVRGLRQLARRSLTRSGRACGALVLACHALAVRHDLVPPGFDRRGRLKAADAEAVMGEWLHQLRRWAALYPEEAFAWKAGSACLGAVLAGLLAMVATIR